MKTLTAVADSRTKFRNIKAEAAKLVGDTACERCPRRAVYAMTIEGASRRICLVCTRARGITAVWLVGSCAA